MEQLQHEKLFGLPAWMALMALAGAGVIGYLLFFKNQGASSSQQASTNQGTTGYSQQALAVMQNPDESATMALQNQELSILAQQFGQFGQQLTDVGTSVDNGFSSVGTSLNGISGQISTQGQQNYSYYQALQNYANAIMSGQIGIDQDVRANQMVMSLLPGGQQAYQTWLQSAGVGARNIADQYLYATPRPATAPAPATS